MPADENEGPLCRICFGPDGFAASGDPAQQLISPCKCSGSVGFVHCSCLYAWRKQRSEQQGFRRSQQCEMCRSQYRIPRSQQQYFDKELLGGALPGPRYALRLLAARLRSPGLAAEFALDMWLRAVMLAGFNRGALQCCSNFNRTLALGLAILQKNTQVMATRARTPGTQGPLAQLPLALASAAFLAALGCEVLVLSGVSAYLGAIWGFGEGSSRMVHATWRVSRRVLSAGLQHLRPVVMQLLLPP